MTESDFYLRDQSMFGGYSKAFSHCSIASDMMVNQVMSRKCRGVSLTIVYQESREGELLATDEKSGYLCTCSLLICVPEVVVGSKWS